MMTKRVQTFENVLNVPAAQVGRFAVKHNVYPAGHVLYTANGRTKLIGGHDIKRVEFDHPVRWHELTEDGGSWMTDLPIEQAQHDRELAGMHGVVLVGGLGLGYAATALCRMPRVSHVWVVEKAPEVVALVAEATRRNLPARHRGKLEVITDDLFAYLKRQRAKKSREPLFTHAFYDIWAPDGEETFFTMVQPLRALSRGVVRHEPVNWNESVMRGQLFYSILGRITMLAFTPGSKAALTLGDPEVSNTVKVLTEGESLERLCTKMPRSEKVSLYHNWRVPFFKWYAAHKPNMAEAGASAREYARWYGRWNWERAWKSATKGVGR